MRDIEEGVANRHEHGIKHGFLSERVGGFECSEGAGKWENGNWQ